jgi:hypothetical protein
MPLVSILLLVRAEESQASSKAGHAAEAHNEIVVPAPETPAAAAPDVPAAPDVSAGAPPEA